jgi:pilus assembly protein CpaC
MYSRTSKPSRLRLTLTSLAISTLVLLGSAVHAQESSYSATFKQKEPIAVNVLVGQSRVINFDKPVGRFSVSNPDIAEAVLVTPSQVLVNGKGFGQVNFIAWEQSGGEYLVFDVFVRTNLSLIDSQIRALFPKDDIRMSQANGSVVLSGSVVDAKTSAQVQSVVEAAGFKTVNMLASPVKAALQVQLHIQVAEVSRNKAKDLGTSYAYQGGSSTGYLNSGGGPSALSDPKVAPGMPLFGSLSSTALNLLLGSGNTLGMIRAMSQQGNLRALAEPNMIVMDGQEASFLAGGEFPVPVIQNADNKTGVSIAVLFKEYGVRLKVKPTIIDEDHIRLELEPEVSTIDFANGVKVDNFVIPALRTRRAKTGIELRDGQSFSLAGLIDNNEVRTLSKVPVIGDIPILGSLFRSKSFQKNETELMFIVTAEIVKPMNRDDLPQMRGIDGLKTGSPLGLEPRSPEIQGKTGHSVTGQTVEPTPAVAPVSSEPVKAEEPKTKTTTATQGDDSSKVSVADTQGVINPAIPVARVITTDLTHEPLKP